MSEWETLDGGSAYGAFGAESGEEARDAFLSQAEQGKKLIEQSRESGKDAVAAAEAEYNAVVQHHADRIAAHASPQELMQIVEQRQAAWDKVIAARQGAVQAEADLSTAGMNRIQAAGTEAQTWARQAAMDAYDKLMAQVGKSLAPSEKQLALRILIGGGSAQDQADWDQKLLPKISQLTGGGAIGPTMSQVQDVIAGRALPESLTNVVDLSGKALSSDQVAALSSTARAGLMSMFSTSPNPSVPPMSNGASTPGLLAFNQAGAAVAKQVEKNSVVTLLVWAAIGYFAWKFLFKKKEAV